MTMRKVKILELRYVVEYGGYKDPKSSAIVMARKIQKMLLSKEMAEILFSVRTEQVAVKFDGNKEVYVVILTACLTEKSEKLEQIASSSCEFLMGYKKIAEKNPEGICVPID